jgi:hypothetical protein
MVEVLVIGQFTPPIGGVTVYNDRLINNLLNDQIVFDYMDGSDSIMVNLVKLIRSKSKLFHISISNTYVIFILIIIGRIRGKKVIITLHGDIGRYTKFRNLLEVINVYLSDIPIVLNQKSYVYSIKINKKTRLISSFIAPENEIKKEVNPALESIDKNKWRSIFCTYAAHISYDKYGQEVYGIKDLLEVFEVNPQMFLIISDPSGQYRKHILRIYKQKLLPNICFVSLPHSFIEILKFSDVFIRATSTDGDSISIKEALFLNKKVIASDVASRPAGCILYSYGNREDLEYKLCNYMNIEVPDRWVVEDGYKEIKKLYLAL